MRIAYIVSRQIDVNDGVVNKIKMQVDYWKKSGHQVQIFCNMARRKKLKDVNIVLDNIYIYNTTTSVPYIGRWIPKKTLVNDLLTFQPDVVYLRFEPFSVYHSDIAKQFPIIMELNTNDLSEMKLLAGYSYRTKLNYLHHRCTRNALFSNITGLVSVTHEIVEDPSIRKYHKPTMVIPNGIDLSSYPVLERSKKNERPALIFLGMNNYGWHGVDKIIRLARLTENDLYFHVVGWNKPAGDIPENMAFHGFLSREEYEKIMIKCDVGIGTLALHRKGMNEGCTLKVREYLAYGLPAIIGYNDTAYLGHETPPWLLMIPNEENNVEHRVGEIVRFSKKMQGRTVPRHEIAEHIDISHLEDKRLSFFELNKGKR